MSSSLLKSAIADAKAIRQTALENAKAALSEAFTPKLSSMLSKKIAEETEQAIDNDSAYTDGTKRENPSGANDRMAAPVVKETYAASKEDGNYSTSPNLSEEEGEEVDPTAVAPVAPEGEVELDVDAPQGVPVDVVPQNGGDVHLDPSVAPQAGVTAPGAVPTAGAENTAPSEDSMELESIIRELEAEASAEGESAEEPSFGGDETDPNNVHVSVAQAPEDVGVDFDDSAVTGDEGQDGAVDVNVQPGDVAGDEEVNLEAILRELEEEGKDEETLSEELTTNQPLKANTDQPQKGNFGSDKTGIDKTPSKGGSEPAIDKAQSDTKYGKDGSGKAGDNLEDFGKATPTLTKENASLKKSLAEYRQTVVFLKGKINEVNLLNAKLLYTNKLFRNHALSNEQKVKVVESLDLTKNVREVKLVYATLAESFSFGSTKKVSSSLRTITEGLASKPTASTKPTGKVILTEGEVQAARFQKLAGIKPKAVLK